MIIADDCSTGNTDDVVNTFLSDGRIHYFSVSLLKYMCNDMQSIKSDKGIVHEHMDYN